MFGNDANTTSKELTTTVTTSISKLEASIQQLEAVKEELAAERQNYFYLNRELETAVARLHHRQQSRWRRVLSLLLTIVLSAVVGAASFAVVPVALLSGGYYPRIAYKGSKAVEQLGC